MHRHALSVPSSVNTLGTSAKCSTGVPRAKPSMTALQSPCQTSKHREQRKHEQLLWPHKVQGSNDVSVATARPRSAVRHILQSRRGSSGTGSLCPGVDVFLGESTGCDWGRGKFLTLGHKQMKCQPRFKIGWHTLVLQFTYWRIN